MERDPHELYRLAAVCKVHMRDACARAGVGIMTPSRWRHQGRRPQERTYNAVRAAIVELAKEKGTYKEEEE